MDPVMASVVIGAFVAVVAIVSMFFGSPLSFRMRPREGPDLKIGEEHQSDSE